MPEILHPGIPLFDPTQSIMDAEQTAALMDGILECRPEHVIPVVWTTRVWVVATTRN